MTMKRGWCSIHDDDDYVSSKLRVLRDTHNSVPRRRRTFRPSSYDNFNRANETKDYTEYGVYGWRVLLGLIVSLCYVI